MPPRGGEGAATLTAPMPGRVIAVRAAAGASVAAHQVVVVIEAMKMEHAVVAPRDGVADPPGGGGGPAGAARRRPRRGLVARVNDRRGARSNTISA